MKLTRHAARSARCGGIAYDLSTSSPVATTNCFRAWGAKVYAADASVIATGALNGRTALEALGLRWLVCRSCALGEAQTGQRCRDVSKYSNMLG